MAEIKAFTGPPAALVHLMKVVMMLLNEPTRNNKYNTGDVDWTQIKSAMRNTAEFLSRLLNYEPQISNLQLSKII